MFRFTALSRRVTPTRPQRRAGLALLVGILAAGCSSRPPEPSRTTFGIANLTNATPSIAARDRTIVLSWTASELDGSQANIMAAVSDDGGVTFGEPIRVNDRVGTVSNSGEQAPRVVIGRTSLALVWSARHNGHSEVVFSRSVDGGRTFSAARTVHEDGLPGLRGWASATFDREDRLHVVWLDGRNAAGPGEASGGPHVHGASSGGAASAAPRQDLFHAVIDHETVTDSLVVEDVCFCCKTSVAARADGSVVALWRHIFPNSVRDIAATVLGRKTGSRQAVTRVGEDNWQIAACPDDGPSSVVGADGAIHAVWPTAVSSRGKGIFFSRSTGDLNFETRQRVDGGDAAGTAHPQIALIDAETAAVVWDEALGDESRVMLRRYNLRTAMWRDAEPLTNSADGIYPVAAGVEGDLLVAWTNRARLPSRITLLRIPRG